MDIEPEWVVLDNEWDYWVYSKGEICEGLTDCHEVTSLTRSVSVSFFDPIENHLRYFDSGEPEQMSLPYVFLR